MSWHHDKTVPKVMAVLMQPSEEKGWKPGKCYNSFLRYKNCVSKPRNPLGAQISVTDTRHLTENSKWTLNELLKSYRSRLRRDASGQLRGCHFCGRKMRISMYLDFHRFLLFPSFYISPISQKQVLVSGSLYTWHQYMDKFNNACRTEQPLPWH